MKRRRAAAVRESWSLRATIATETPGWRTRMSCLGAQPSIFYDGPVKAARAICEDCPTRLSCLAAAHAEEFALGIKDIFGIRGGLTAAERFAGRQA